MNPINRRAFLRDYGLPSTAAPFLFGLPSVTGALPEPKPRRLIIVFTANGIIPGAMWPDKEGPIEKLKPILEPLEPFRCRIRHRVVRHASNG